MTLNDPPNFLISLSFIVIIWNVQMGESLHTRRECQGRIWWLNIDQSYENVGGEYPVGCLCSAGRLLFADDKRCQSERPYWATNWQMLVQHWKLSGDRIWGKPGKMLSTFNTLRPRTMDATFQTTFSNAFSSMKMYEFLLIFHRSLLLGVQLTIFHHWFR